MQLITRGVVGIICVALAVLFVYLAVFSLFYTSIFDPALYVEEHVLRVRDNLLLNLLLFFLGLAGLRLLSKLAMRLPLKLITGLALGVTFLGGILWVSMSHILPRADQWQVYQTATELIAGPIDPGSYAHTYLQRYPFQIGQLLYLEGMQRLFGPECYTVLRIVNVFALIAVYAALLSILWQTLRSPGVQRCAAILLSLFAPGVLYVTFIYGTLPGLALALLGAEQCCRWMRQGGALHGAAGILLPCLSVIFKLNCLIIAVAAGLVLFLFALRHRRWIAGVLAVCAVVCPLVISKVPIRALEARTRLPIGNGTPQAAWLVMGMQEGPRAAGWYTNDYVWSVLPDAGYDQELATQRVARDLMERLSVFWRDPAYAVSFFHSKLTSQWAETTFESIWVNRPERGPGGNPSLRNRFLNSDFLPQYMDAYANILFAAFAAGLFTLARSLLSRKQSGPILPYGLIVLVIAVLGGLLYHWLFEASSQYIFSYTPLMIPVAAYGLMRLPWPSRCKGFEEDALEAVEGPSEPKPV